jgi:transposase
MIDIFSRFLWVRALKSKKDEEVSAAICDIFQKGERYPTSVRSDHGLEFRAKVVQSMLKEVGVQHILTQNQVKANYAERVIKTLKSKIFRYMLQQGNHRYIDQIQNFVDSYNASKHRSLGRPPKEVTKENESMVRLDQIKLKTKQPAKREIETDKKKKKRKRKKKNPYKYEIGNQVRLSHMKSLFDREYQQKWTGEVFKVRGRYMRDDIPVYKLEDLMGEPIDGTMYSEELQLVHIDDSTVYRIDKVLSRRTRRGKKEALVSWLGWPDKFNTWIDASEVKAYGKKS